MEAIKARACRSIIDQLIEIIESRKSSFTEEQWRELWGGRDSNLPEDLYVCTSLSANENMSYSVVAAHPSCDWDWTALSAVKNQITMQDFLNHRDKPWHWKYVAARAETMEQAYEIVPANQWDDSDNILWMRGPVTMNDAYNHSSCLRNDRLHVPAHLDDYHIYNNISIDKIVRNAARYADWCTLSRNSGVQFRDVMQHFNYPWCIGCLSRNPNIRMQNVRDHAYLNWNYFHLSENKSLTLSDVLTRPSKTDYVKYLRDHHVMHTNPTEWHWPTLSKNMNVTMQEVMAHQHLPWDWTGLSQNPNIRLADIKDINVPWNMFHVMANSFVHDHIDYIERYTRQHMAAFLIQKHWRKISADPSMRMCHRIQPVKLSHINGPDILNNM